MNTVKFLFVTIFLFSQILSAQNIEEKMNFNGGYYINIYNDNLELLSREKYIDNQLVDKASFNPNNGYREGKYFDGVNHFYYDSLSYVQADNFVYSVTDEFRNLTNWMYDEIIIANMRIWNNHPDGQGFIIGYNYPVKQSYDPIGTYVMSNALGFKSPQYAYSRIKDADPITSDTIGSFKMIRGVYKDSAYFKIKGGKEIKIIFNDNGTPIYFEEKNQNEISLFDVDSKFFKYKNELFFSPKIDSKNHSFIKLIERKLNQEETRKYSKFPIINFDFISGNIGLDIEDIASTDPRGEAYQYDPTMRILYYGKSGVFYTETSAGTRYIYGDEGRYRTKPYQKDNYDEILPKYYFKLNFGMNYQINGKDSKERIYSIFEDKFNLDWNYTSWNNFGMTKGSQIREIVLRLNSELAIAHEIPEEKEWNPSTGKFDIVTEAQFISKKWEHSEKDFLSFLISSQTEPVEPSEALLRMSGKDKSWMLNYIDNNAYGPPPLWFVNLVKLNQDNNTYHKFTTNEIRALIEDNRE